MTYLPMNKNNPSKGVKDNDNKYDDRQSEKQIDSHKIIEKGCHVAHSLFCILCDMFSETKFSQIIGQILNLSNFRLEKEVRPQYQK